MLIRNVLIDSYYLPIAGLKNIGGNILVCRCGPLLEMFNGGVPSSDVVGGGSERSLFIFSQTLIIIELLILIKSDRDNTDSLPCLGNPGFPDI